MVREPDQGSSGSTLKLPPVKAGEIREFTSEADFLGRKWTEGYEVAGYRGLEPRHLFHPARTEIRGIAVKFAPVCESGICLVPAM